MFHVTNSLRSFPKAIPLRGAPVRSLNHHFCSDNCKEIKRPDYGKVVKIQTPDFSKILHPLNLKIVQDVNKFPLHTVLKKCNMENDEEIDQLIADVKKLIQTGCDLNEKDPLGHSPLYYVIQYLPFIRVSTRKPFVINILNLLVTHGAKFDQNEFWRRSVFAHLMMNGGNWIQQERRCALAIHLINSKLIDFDETSSPYVFALESFLRLKELPMHNVLIALRKNQIPVLNPVFADSSPFLHILKKYLSVPGIHLKDICFALYAVSVGNTQAINETDEKGCSALDYALMIDSDSNWKTYIVHCLLKDGAVVHPRHRNLDLGKKKFLRTELSIPTKSLYYSNEELNNFILIPLHKNHPIDKLF